MPVKSFIEFVAIATLLLYSLRKTAWNVWSVSRVRLKTFSNHELKYERTAIEVSELNMK